MYDPEEAEGTEQVEGRRVIAAIKAIISNAFIQRKIGLERLTL